MIAEEYLVFHTVARIGSISQASKALYMTQSTITRRIQALEKDLGFDLFVRTDSGLVLTPAGESLKLSLESIRPLCDKAMREASDISHGKHELVTIGYGPITFSPWFAKMLEIMAVRNEGMEIALVVDRESRLYKKLLYRDVDVAVLSEQDIQSTGAMFYPVFQSKMVAYAPEGHPLSQMESVSLSDLIDCQCVMFSLPGSSLQYSRFVSKVSEAGFSTDFVRTIDSPETGLLYASLGRGVYVASDLVLGRAESLGLVGRTVEYEGAPIEGPAVGFGYAKPELRPFVELLAECASEAVGLVL